jgi:hypothetical protein
VLLDKRPARIWQDEAAFDIQRKAAEAIRSDPHWKFLARFPQVPYASPWIDVYGRVGPEPTGEISLDLRYTLGKQIVHLNCRRGRRVAHSAN